MFFFRVHVMIVSRREIHHQLSTPESFTSPSLRLQVATPERGPLVQPKMHPSPGSATMSYIAREPLLCSVHLTTSSRLQTVETYYLHVNKGYFTSSSLHVQVAPELMAALAPSAISRSEVLLYLTLDSHQFHSLRICQQLHHLVGILPMKT